MRCSEVSLSELEQLAPPPEPVGVEDAHAQAFSLLEAARAEASSLRAAAVEEGRLAGIEQGRIEAQVALEPALSAIGAARDQIDALQIRAAERTEAEAVTLALQIAEKVVASALEVRPELVVDVVRGALRGLIDAGRIIVSVHPDDVELVRSAVEGHGSLGHIEVHEERRVARGGALVRTSQGETDATIAAKLSRVAEVVREELAA